MGKVSTCEQSIIYLKPKPHDGCETCSSILSLIAPLYPHHYYLGINRQNVAARQDIKMQQSCLHTF